MAQKRQNRLLWVDDDKPDKFLYEQMILKNEGWDIRWATTVVEAARTLSDERYQALLLDQMLPYEEDKRPDVWSGCLLLRWLRQAELRTGNELEENYLELHELKPLRENTSMEVIVVSAYADETVEQEMRSASERDRNLLFEPKPVILDDILDILRGLMEE
jgi:CheY-like chemotaxis protein